MKVPYSWLKEYVDLDVTAEELQDKLFSCGFEVEELINLGGEISKVVVAEVKSCEKVEGTHLVICKVNCGEYGDDIQIVTGAPNVYEGMHTPARRDPDYSQAAEGDSLERHDVFRRRAGTE